MLLGENDLLRRLNGALKNLCFFFHFLFTRAVQGAVRGKRSNSYDRNPVQEKKKIMCSFLLQTKFIFYCQASRGCEFLNGMPVVGKGRGNSG